MPTNHKHSKERCKYVVENKIRYLKKEGYKNPKQRIAIALSYARKKGCKV